MHENNCLEITINKNTEGKDCPRLHLYLSIFNILNSDVLPLTAEGFAASFLLTFPKCPFGILEERVPYFDKKLLFFILHSLPTKELSLTLKVCVYDCCSY